MRTTRADTRNTERHAAYQANEAFYHGDPSAQLTQLSTLKRDEVRAVFNYARDILNKHAAATVNGLTCAIKPPPLRSHTAATLIEDAQQALDRALRNSNAFTTDFAAALNAGVLGDSGFYISHANGEVYYRLLHPGDVDVLDWRADGKPARMMIQHDDRIETWTDDALLVEQGQSRQLYHNPYGLIPAVIFANWPRPGSRWGDSTLEHIKAACRLLNERLDLLMWLIRVQGNPPIKALGVDKAVLRTDPGELWTGPADAQIDLVKLLDAETSGIHINTISLLLQTIKELSNTPDIAFGIGNLQLSGRALEFAFLPMSQAAAIRRGFLADAVQQRNRAILRMIEVLHARDFTGCLDTNVSFSPIVPADKYTDRNQDRRDVLLGALSRRTYVQRHGGGVEPRREMAQVLAESAVYADYPVSGANKPDGNTESPISHL